MLHHLGDYADPSSDWAGLSKDPFLRPSSTRTGRGAYVAYGVKSGVLASQSAVSSGSHSRHGSTERKTKSASTTEPFIPRLWKPTDLPATGQIKIRALELRQINPTGKSLLIFRNRVKPRNQKYSAFAVGQISARTSAVLPTEGRAHVNERGAGCGGSGSVRRAIASRTNDADAYGQVVSF